MARSTATTARARVRAELVGEITAMARNHVAEHGASALSLRAVARDLGMVSSALYRYFPSRDALLTALIVEAYDSLGSACEAADAILDRADLLGRWRTIAMASRAWALANPHEYALIYGTPVPGYDAPDDTIDPATRVGALMLTLLADIEAAGVRFGGPTLPIATALGSQLEAVSAFGGGDLDRHRLLQGLGAWVLVFGMINFELFGTFRNTFDDAADLFGYQVDLMATHLGLGTD